MPDPDSLIERYTIKHPMWKCASKNQLAIIKVCAGGELEMPEFVEKIPFCQFCVEFFPAP